MWRSGGSGSARMVRASIGTEGWRPPGLAMAHLRVRCGAHDRLSTGGCPVTP